jgi:signal transduction histidine kinase
VAAQVHAAVQQALSSRTIVDLEYSLTDESEPKDFEARVVAAAEGEALVIVRDITGRKRAAREREQLERELEQVRKMESIGQLAGGIAHDFNNLLGVITGYAELAARDLDPGHRARARIDEILRAAERAASLTRQLLAFSRQQVVRPRLLDLQEVVRGLEPMLKRILGEKVRLVTWFAPDHVTVNADRGQIEQIVMNLAINARDAMPRGGRLTLHIARKRLDEAFVRSHPHARAGAFALLEVSDEGTGMDAATILRIFEPFFTTKGMGRGTGLGLSTVYGIVKQNGGHIDVESTPGTGSVFRVFWPEAEGTAPAVAADAVASAEVQGGAETILLLEDEDGLRAIAREILEDAGYRVVEASNVGEGVALASRPSASIDAILSDVVMPGATGPQGVTLIRAIHPRVRVLYMSGYPDLDQRHGTLGPEDEMITKPFTADALLRRIRDVLDRA